MCWLCMCHLTKDRVGAARVQLQTSVRCSLVTKVKSWFNEAQHLVLLLHISPSTNIDSKQELSISFKYVLFKEEIDALFPDN